MGKYEDKGIMGKWFYRNFVCNHRKQKEVKMPELETWVNGRIEKHVYHRLCEECGKLVATKTVEYR